MIGLVPMSIGPDDRIASNTNNLSSDDPDGLLDRHGGLGPVAVFGTFHVELAYLATHDPGIAEVVGDHKLPHIDHDSIDDCLWRGSLRGESYAVLHCLMRPSTCEAPT